MHDVQMLNCAMYPAYINAYNVMDDLQSESLALPQP